MTMMKGIRMENIGCVRTVTKRILPLVLAGNWASEVVKVLLLKQWTGKRILMGLSMLLVGASLLGCAQELSGRPDNSSNPEVSSQDPGKGEAVATPTSVRLSARFFRATPEGQALVAFLNCEDFDCIETLEIIKDFGPDLAPILVELVQHGPPPGVPELNERLAKERAVIVLGELGAAEDVDPLIGVLTEPDPVLRARTVTALGQIGGDEALEALLPMLKDPDQLVREMTATALGRLGDSQAIPALQAAAQVEQKDHVRQAMNEAIEMLE